MLKDIAMKTGGRLIVGMPFLPSKLPKLLVNTRPYWRPIPVSAVPKQTSSKRTSGQNPESTFEKTLGRIVDNR